MDAAARMFLYLIIYSVVGWVYESTLCSITQRRLVNRGFLNGPLCPIYGFGAVAVILLLPGGQDESLIKLFLSSSVLCCILEYFTSCLLYTSAHGMAEHSGRYDDFMHFLAERGIVAFCMDHAGHGRSARTEAEYGFFGDEGGMAAAIGDMRRFTQWLSGAYPNIPLMLMGHSTVSYTHLDVYKRQSLALRSYRASRLYPLPARGGKWRPSPCAQARRQNGPSDPS